MKTQHKIMIGKLVSPVAHFFLRTYTVITRTERARAIVRNESGEVLLVRNFIGPMWSLPGGGIERSETPQAAALRELYEETGIIATEDTCRLLGILTSEKIPVNYTAHLFEIAVNKRSLPAIQHNTHEIIEVAWFSLDALPQDLSPIVRPCLDLLSKS